MSHRLISRSQDLRRLRDEGYDLEVRSGYLLVKDVPYVDASRQVKRGILVSVLVLAGDVTARPDSHVAYFVGGHPCRPDGSEIAEIKNQSQRVELAEDVVIDHTFSAKPQPTGIYEDYYAKVTTYASILGGPARTIDASATAKMFPVIKAEDGDSEAVFRYLDTATSRAQIEVVSKKTESQKIAIIGLGGTGSYVLDFVAKTRAREIHLFDGDLFLQHNAFRSPGAPTIEKLASRARKSAYYKELYSQMRDGIVDHGAYVTGENVEELRGMDFVFLCLDRSSSKKLIIKMLEEFAVPFVDVGMGISLTDASLGGILRVTTSTPAQRGHVEKRIPLEEGADNEYSHNVQIAELNALNAALAVIKWKKSLGFYRDFKQELHSTYTIDGNLLLSEDCSS
jgi:hypothetical protein